MHLTITRSLANKSITDLVQYHLTTFQTVKVSAICQKCFSIALNRKVVRKACEAFVSKCTYIVMARCIMLCVVMLIFYFYDITEVKG